ncbi:hypothetical protein [Mediterraneibacter gnavus]|uniref:hypothetical protein n=1 Tax=Mediterraneibacter gnavus TaxID=33038 RepID=UPI002053F298|nr:hypothetical protein [Mediterraneibacter gnavus]MDB8711737.1 hypothetical protein [Mediterraneibacter gnavus]MDB8714750.1 hypothetical protein [Mediterraneibacter gnavus]DAG81565.1 MAG TPA: protein of unknown function DUF4177 [Caudoviricetes sp.]
MYDEIIQIREIRDDENGAEKVNSLLKKGWKFISACQVGTLDSMDIVYVVGATTKDVIDNESKDNGEVSRFREILNRS